MKPLWSERKQVNLQNPFEVLISKIVIVVLYLYFFSRQNLSPDSLELLIAPTLVLRRS